MMTYTIKQLKKMNINRIARIFKAIYGRVFENPSAERQYMIVVLVGRFGIELLENNPVVGKYAFDVSFSEVLEFNNDVVLDDFSQMFGENWYIKKSQIHIKVSVVGSSIIDKINAAVNNTWLPIRTEEKGRKSRFSYNDVWDMIYSDLQGMRLTDIAQYFQTSCAVVLQILTGKSYSWASGIDARSFE